MLFCCFRNANAAEGSRDTVPGKFTELQREGAAVENGAASPNSNLQVHVQSSQPTAQDAPGQRQPTVSAGSPQAKSAQVSQDSVMRVVALLQELLGLTSERMQVSRIMALLCQRLSMSWACLTALSADGEVFQHVGSAYVVESKIGTCSFSSCRTNSGLPQGAGPPRGPPSRTSSTNSIAGMTAVEVGLADPHLLRGSDTSIEAATISNHPLLLSEPAGTGAGLGASAPAAGAGPPAGAAGSPPRMSHGQQSAAGQPPTMFSSSGAGQDLAPTLTEQGPSSALEQPAPPAPSLPPAPVSAEDRSTMSGMPVSAWPIDWQLLHRERSLRAFACLPVTATNGSGTVVGCLSFGSTEPLDWSKQFWAGSMTLITGWAAGAITTTRATARASFYSRLFGATNLDGLARAFAYDMPVFLADGAAGPGTALPEVRLALVSSRLQHAVVYAAPLLQVSGRLGLGPGLMRPYGGGGGGPLGLGGGGYANGNGIGGPGAAAAGPLIAFGSSGPSGSGASLMAGLVLGSQHSLGTERGLVLTVPADRSPAAAAATAHPAAAGSRGGAGGGTAAWYDTTDCMVLGTTLDTDDQASGCSSSNSGGGAQSGRRGNQHHGGGGSDGSKTVSPQPASGDRGKGRSAGVVPEAPPVDCVKISTDSTLLMSVLEAGDIMIIKDALQYFGGGRMVARDLALNNTRPATAGTLVILPLVHRCRSLGCVYVFARNELNLMLSRAAWGDLAAMLSRAVFSQLVGKLRHEWYDVLSEDPEPPAAPHLRGSRSHGAMGGPGTGSGGRGRVRRTTTGNSLNSNASSLRPSFELPSRSVEQAAGAAANRETAAALAAAAQVLEYAGFMLPDCDEGPTTAGGTAGPGGGQRSPGGTLASSPRHRIPAEHAGLGSFGGGSGGGGGGSAGGGTGSSEPPSAPTAMTWPKPSPDAPSTSPGSLSFRLPAEMHERVGTPAGAVAAAAAAAAAAFAAEATAAEDPGPDSAGVSSRAAQPPEGSGEQQQVPPSPPQQQHHHQQQQTPLEPWRAPRGGEALVSGPAAPRKDLAIHSPARGTSSPAGAGADGGGGPSSGAAAVEGAATPTDVADVEAEEAEEISGSSRELQGWPELVDILYDMHRTRNVSVYLAAYRGRAVAIKMMRSYMSMDGRPGHLESEALTIAAQQQLSTVRHPNVLRVLMVYPLVYEVVAGKGHRAAPGGGGGSFVAHGGGGGGGGNGVTAGGAPAAAGHGHGHAQSQSQQQLLLAQQQQQQQQLLMLLQQQCGMGLEPFNAVGHTISDLLACAGAAEAPGVGVYLTAVLPRREKFKRGMALMLELFPSVSLREALQKRMLVPTAAADGGGGLTIAEQLAAAVPYTYVNSQTTTTSDGGHPGTPTGGGPTAAAGSHLSGGHPHLPHAQGAFMAAVLLGPGPASGGDNAFGAVDSSPGLALTCGSNSGGNAANYNSGPGGAAGGGGSAAAAGTPSMTLLLSILSQIVAGMAALHSAGLPHGELRPENVLLAMPHHNLGGFAGVGGGVGGCSRVSSGHHDRNNGGGGGGGNAAASSGGGGGEAGTPRVSPTPTPHRAMYSSSGGGGGGGQGGQLLSGSGSVGGGGVSSNSRTRSVAGAVLSGSSGYGEPERFSRPERPQPGRPITAEVIVKIKDAGMTVVGFSKGSQTVRKLLQRNRSAVLPYLPPEVHRGERFGRGADVYMFGILMWELYTGGVAFSNLAGTPIKLLQTIIADGVRPPWPEGTPVWYQSLASRCWSGNPKQRPSFRRIGEKLAEATTALAAASAAAAAGGWPGGGGGLQGVAEVL